MTLLHWEPTADHQAFYTKTGVSTPTIHVNAGQQISVADAVRIIGIGHLLEAPHIGTGMAADRLERKILERDNAVTTGRKEYDYRQKHYYFPLYRKGYQIDATGHPPLLNEGGLHPKSPKLGLTSNDLDQIVEHRHSVEIDDDIRRDKDPATREMFEILHEQQVLQGEDVRTKRITIIPQIDNPWEFHISLQDKQGKEQNRLSAQIATTSSDRKAQRFIQLSYEKLRQHVTTTLPLIA